MNEIKHSIEAIGDSLCLLIKGENSVRKHFSKYGISRL